MHCALWLVFAIRWNDVMEGFSFTTEDNIWNNCNNNAIAQCQCLQAMFMMSIRHWRYHSELIPVKVNYSGQLIMKTTIMMVLMIIMMLPSDIDNRSSELSTSIETVSVPVCPSFAREIWSSDSAQSPGSCKIHLWPNNNTHGISFDSILFHSIGSNIR